MQTDAPKSLKRLSKHSHAQIATGVSGLIKAWKATVTAEAQKKEVPEEKTPSKVTIEVDDKDKSNPDGAFVKGMAKCGSWRVFGNVFRWDERATNRMGHVFHFVAQLQKSP
eukprot:3152324-Pyramimonas_sp.AAC.1